MCDAVGVVLGQKVDKKPTVICYAIKILVKAYIHYTMIKKGALGSGLCLREVLALHLGEQDHHLHKSCNTKVRAL